MKTGTIVKVLIALLVLAVGFGIVYAKYFQNPGEENASPMVFQPDSQVLSRAMGETNNLTRSRSILADNPINAKGVPYVYDADLCENSPALYGCYVDHYKTLVKDYGVTTASADIQKRSQESSSILSQCHPLMHVIGRQAVGNYKTISEAFANGDSFCWSGYYHGIMEGMIANIGLENLSKELNTICADIPGKDTYNFNYYNCVHGLGHGIMAILKDELFDSLKMCDSLTGFWEQESCYGGVYMQNIIDSTNVADHKNGVKYLKPAEPLYPCTAVDTKYKGQCYLGQTSYALQVTGFNYKKVFVLCGTVEQPYRDICNQSMGRDVANQAHHEKQKTKEMCEMATDPNDITNCVIGAVKEIISYYHSDKEALEYCKILGGNDKDICTTTAKSYYSNF